MRETETEDVHSVASEFTKRLSESEKKINQVIRVSTRQGSILVIFRGGGGGWVPRFIDISPNFSKEGGSTFKDSRYG